MIVADLRARQKLRLPEFGIAITVLDVDDCSVHLQVHSPRSLCVVHDAAAEQDEAADALLALVEAELGSAATLGPAETCRRLREAYAEVADDAPILAPR